MLWNVFLSLEGLTKKAAIGLMIQGDIQIHSIGGSGAHNAVEVHKTQQLHFLVAKCSMSEAAHLQLESPKLLADKDNQKRKWKQRLNLQVESHLHQLFHIGKHETKTCTNATFYWYIDAP